MSKVLHTRPTIHTYFKINATIKVTIVQLQYFIQATMTTDQQPLPYVTSWFSMTQLRLRVFDPQATPVAQQQH